jgi:hypothetical protein
VGGTGVDVHDLIIGIISGLLSLVVLFSIKPRLRLTLEPYIPSDDPDDAAVDAVMRAMRANGFDPGMLGLTRNVLVAHRQARHVLKPRVPDQCRTGQVRYRVLAENLGLGRIVEIEARLWQIKQADRLATRHQIPIEVDRLLECSGKWHEATRKQHEINVLKVGDTKFRFRFPAEVSAKNLRAEERYLFQVWSKHGFTNFGRVHLMRIDQEGGNLTARPVDQPGRPKLRFEPAATAIAGIAKLIMRVLNHLHPFKSAANIIAGLSDVHRLELLYLYTKEISATDESTTGGTWQTVILIRCAVCGLLDTKSVPGRLGMDEAVSIVQEGIAGESAKGRPPASVEFAASRTTRH